MTTLEWEQKGDRWVADDEFWSIEQGINSFRFNLYVEESCIACVKSVEQAKELAQRIENVIDDFDQENKAAKNVAEMIGWGNE